MGHIFKRLVGRGCQSPSSILGSDITTLQSPHYGGVLLPEKYILFERFKNTIFLLVVLTIGQGVKIVLKQCQLNGSTNHGERGVVLQTPRKCDWMALS